MMFMAGIIILPLSSNWIREDPLVANIAITSGYALINFTRSFLIRRLFAKYGFYENIVKLRTIFKKFVSFCKHPEKMVLIFKLIGEGLPIGLILYSFVASMS